MSVNYFNVTIFNSVFGNMDNVKYIRSMVTVTALNVVDILVMEAEDFYKLIAPYPTVLSKIKKHLLLENLVRSHLVYASNIFGNF